MTTNLTNLTGAQNFYQVALFVAEETDYIFFSLFVIVLFMIMFMALKRFGTEDAIWVSSFTCFLVSAILVSMNLVITTLIWFFLGIFVITGFYVWSTRGGA